ncbi:MAG: hypothetical protein ABIG11_05885 [bacterium]
MIKKWEIRPAPSKSDSNRHQLLFAGQISDVHLLLKKLGGLCGRPEKAEHPYNFSVYLMRFTPKTIRRFWMSWPP